MNVSQLRIRTLALGAALSVIAIQMLGGKQQPVESAGAVADRAHQVARETNTQRAGRLSYVKTTFALPASTTTAGDALCPKGSQLTGAFGSGLATGGGSTSTLVAILVRRDGKDRGRVADNGVRAIVNNPTAIAGQGTVEAICERAKKRRR